MAYTNIEEAISGKLSASWALVGDLAVANVHFTTGWYDSKKTEYPQVTVSHLFPHSDSEIFFGDSSDDDKAYSISREIFGVNVWFRVPAGESVGDNIDNIERMRAEAYRIFLVDWKTYTVPSGISAVLPRNRGTPLYDTTRQTRMLRVEIEVQVNIIQ